MLDILVRHHSEIGNQNAVEMLGRIEDMLHVGFPLIGLVLREILEVFFPYVEHVLLRRPI